MAVQYVNRTITPILHRRGVVVEPETISVSSTTVTGVNTIWSDQGVAAGTIIILDANGQGSGPENATIASVDSNTQITLSSAPSGTFNAGTTYNFTQQMVEAQFTTRGSQNWKKWDNCVICTFSYPEEELVYIDGAPYCIRFQHFLDPPGTGGIKDSGG